MSKQNVNDKLQNAVTVVQSVTPTFLPADGGRDDPGDRAAARIPGLPSHRHPGGPCFDLKTRKVRALGSTPGELTPGISGRFRVSHAMRQPCDWDGRISHCELVIVALSRMAERA